MAWTLDRITIYPVKSLDGVDVESSVVLPSGGLEHDRRFALADENGSLMNAKRSADLQRIAARFDLGELTVTLADRDAAGIPLEETARAFSLTDDSEALAAWVSQRIGRPLRLVENTAGGFPDDRVLRGPTVLSRQTLLEVADWFDGMSADEARRRFRANLELDADEVFAEERLLGPSEDRVTRFRIGTVLLEGVHPSVRCAVPMRNSQTGVRDDEFQRTFIRRRRETLPDWADAERYTHFFRLAVNTRPDRQTEPDDDSRGVIRVGDEVEILEVVGR